MTLIVGVRFQDGVGVAGDTRVVKVNNKKGTIVRKWDICEKVYYVEPFIIGVSGDVKTCAQLLIAYFKEFFIHNKMDREAIKAKANDLEWITEFFKRTYKQIVDHQSLSPPPPVGLIIASCGQTSTSTNFQGEKIFALGKPTMREAAKRFYGAKKEVHSVVASLCLPEGKVQIASPGEILMMGSGRYIDSKLAENAAVFTGTTEVSLGARMDLVLSGFANFAMSNVDITFNNLVHSIFMDDVNFGYKGSAHDAALDKYKYELDVDDLAIPAKKEDMRKDILFMQQRGGHWRELYYKNLTWWILDYKKNLQIPLRNILLDFHKNTTAKFYQGNLLV